MKSSIGKIPVLMLMAVACSQLVFTDRSAEFEHVKEKAQERIVVLDAKLEKLEYIAINTYPEEKRKAKKAEHRYLERLLDSYEESLVNVDEIESKIDAAFVNTEV